MKNKILLGGCVSVLLLAACTEQMNYNEYNIYDKDYITLNFNNVGGFLTDIYNTVEYDYGNFSNGAMLSSATDESEYSIMGNAIEDYYNGGWSPSNPKSTTWTNMYAGISACNILFQCKTVVLIPCFNICIITCHIIRKIIINNNCVTFVFQTRERNTF